MNGSSNVNENGSTRSSSRNENSNIQVFDDRTGNGINNVKIRIKESGKAKWQRFLHGGKWQASRLYQRVVSLVHIDRLFLPGLCRTLQVALPVSVFSRHARFGEVS